MEFPSKQDKKAILDGFYDKPTLQDKAVKWWAGLSTDAKVNIANFHRKSAEDATSNEIINMYHYETTDTMCSCGLLQSQHQPNCKNEPAALLKAVSAGKELIPDPYPQPQIDSKVVTTEEVWEEIKGEPQEDGNHILFVCEGNNTEFRVPYIMEKFMGKWVTESEDFDTITIVSHLKKSPPKN